MVLRVYLIFSLTLISINALAKKTVRVCLDSHVITLDPHQAQDTSSSDATHIKIYEPLVKKFGDKKIQIAPLLKDVENNPKVSHDYLTFTFELKKNISFHSNKFFKPTRKMNAQDVLFSFERQIKPKEYGLKLSMLDKLGIKDKIKSIKVLSSHKIKFTFKEPMPNFLDYIETSVGAIMSKEYYDFLKRKNRLNLFTLRPIGSGPFKFQEFLRSSSLELKAFKKYHLGEVAFDELHFLSFPAKKNRLELLNYGICDIVNNPDPIQVESIKSNAKYRIVHGKLNNMSYIAFNTDKKPFDDIKVRKAISHALNIKKYNKEIFADQAFVANHLLTPDMEGYSSKTKLPEYNLEKAKKLMSQSKYPKGFVIKLWTVPVKRTYNPNGYKIARLVKEDLAKIGIEASVVKASFKSFLKQTYAGNYTLSIAGWANTDETEILSNLSCVNKKKNKNRARWCKESFDKVAKKYISSSLKDDKKASSKILFDEFSKELPWFPMFYIGKLKVISNKIENFFPQDRSAEDYSTISIRKNSN